MKPSVVIVEDDRQVRENLEVLVRSDQQLRFVGAFASAEEAMRGFPALQPDLAIMDINLPKMSGIECVARLKQTLPRMQVLMLTVYDDGDNVFRALKAGASGYAERSGPGRGGRLRAHDRARRDRRARTPWPHPPSRRAQEMDARAVLT